MNNEYIKLEYTPTDYSMPQLTKKILLIAISAALILVSLYPYSPKKDYRISITDQVEINFDSVYNTLLNDTFYFPKVFGSVNLFFEERESGFEILHEKKHNNLRDKMYYLKTYLAGTRYYCYPLSDKQLKSFRDYHDYHFGEAINMGERLECLDFPVEVYFSLPLICTKFNGDCYLVFDYVFYNADKGTKIGFESNENFYFNRISYGNYRWRLFNDYSIQCEGVSLNYPIIFKWDKQMQSWKLRNTKAMHEADIKELGFKRVMFD